MTPTSRKGTKKAKTAAKPTDGHWTFFTNHGTVLLYIADHPDDTMHAVAHALDMTERTTATVIAELRATGYLSVERRGRNNHYSVNGAKPLRRGPHSKFRVRALLGALSVLDSEEKPGRKRRPARKAR